MIVKDQTTAEIDFFFFYFHFLFFDQQTMNQHYFDVFKIDCINIKEQWTEGSSSSGSLRGKIRGCAELKNKKIPGHDQNKTKKQKTWIPLLLKSSMSYPEDIELWDHPQDLLVQI
jgi:hypothetical protein